MTKPAIQSQLEEIYTLMCRSAMNKEYYSISLHKNQTISTWMDIVIAVGTAGSGISALKIWNTEYGKIVWAVFSAVATFFALSKPFIQVNKRIERHARLFIGHSDIYASIIVLVSRIRRKNMITDDMNAAFEVAESRFMELSKDDDPHPNLELLGRCEEAVRMRHPPERAWYPDLKNVPLEAASVPDAPSAGHKGTPLSKP